MARKVLTTTTDQSWSTFSRPCFRTLPTSTRRSRRHKRTRKVRAILLVSAQQRWPKPDHSIGLIMELASRSGVIAEASAARRLVHQQFAEYDFGLG
jgi:hypothetical protein